MELSLTFINTKNYLNGREMRTFINMKQVAVILSFLILFLTVAPTLPVVFSSSKTTGCGMTCCAHERQKSLPKGCPSGMGNPFMSCCSIFALTSHPHDVSELSLKSTCNFISPVKKSCSDFVSDAWHPPKFV